ncbi:MAG TPA: hypothetical protein EYN89_09375 [Flavobacteriales bacterium]|nr:hypothetical protein [Flavobacteriales bacterium]
MTHNIASYQKEGFVLYKTLVPSDFCDSIIESFENEVLPFKGKILRSTSAKMEKHRLSKSGMMTNPILQIQDLEGTQFSQFQHRALNALGSVIIQKTIRTLLGVEPVLIQSVFYHSSMGTSTHEDSHYFDSIDGRMLGCWIALEDIDEKAGRLCVYPRTHNLCNMDDTSNETYELFRNYQKQSLEVIRSYKNLDEGPSLVDFVDRIKTIRKIIRQLKIKPYSPALKKGDAIIFSSRLFHSSLDPDQNSEQSRASLIGHFVPNGIPIIRYQEDIEALNTYKRNGLFIQQSQSY